MTRPHRSEPRSRLFRVNDRRVLASGLATSFWGDFYHQCMTVRWPVFFAGYAIFFFAANCVFAGLYLFGTNPIANARPDTLDLFFFSIETLATVGYGDMHPQTTYGHAVATTEIFFGLSMLAVVTGLVFQRFARPRARILFARRPVVVLHEGEITLMIRMANERHNNISNANAKLWLIRNETSREGHRFRRFHRLPIERDQNPVFALSWTIFHRIDENSLLWHAGPADLAHCDADFLVTIDGHDETSGQEVHVRQLYTHEDLLWNHRYVDILATGSDGVLRIDYTRFHDAHPEPVSQPG